jgi:hypothetical protein
MSDFDDDFGFGEQSEEETTVIDKGEESEAAASEAEAAESEAEAEKAETDGEMSEGEMKEGHDGMQGKHDMMHDSPFEMMMKVETLMRWSSIDPFMGNLTYLLVAAGVTTQAALMAFRYASRTGYYLSFISGTGTNWFEIGDLIQNYANLSLFGIAFITQLLALFGIAAWLNALVWFWGVMLVGGLANGIGAFFKFLAYDNCYDKAAGCQSTTKADMVAGTAMSTSVSLTLYMQAENWMWGIWDAQTQEEKETQVEELLMEVEEWEAEMRAEMEAEMGEKEGEKAEESEEAEVEEKTEVKDDEEKEVEEDKDAEKDDDKKKDDTKDEADVTEEVVKPEVSEEEDPLGDDDFFN